MISSQLLLPSRATFGDHIMEIICGCAEKKMIGIDAWRIIAVMTNEQTAWDFATMQLPGNAMDVRRHSRISATSASYSDNSITIRQFSAGPYPAILSLLYSFPKSIYQRVFGTFILNITSVRAERSTFRFAVTTKRGSASKAKPSCNAPFAEGVIAFLRAEIPAIVSWIIFIDEKLFAAVEAGCQSLRSSRRSLITIMGAKDSLPRTSPLASLKFITAISAI